MHFALLMSVTILTTTILVILCSTIVFRAGRITMASRTQKRHSELRRLLVELTLGERLNAQASQLSSYKLSDLDELSQAIATKIKGEAKQTIVDLLEERGSIDKAIRRTRNLGAIGRCRAASLLGNLAIDRSRGALEELLKDRNREVRVQAARALGNIGDPRSVPAILNCLDSRRNSLPFGVAIVALSKIGISGTQYLIDALSGRGEKQRGACAEILGLLNAIRAIPSLIDQYHSDESTDVKIRCARALGRIGSPKALGALLKGLESENLSIRLVTCRALAQIGHRDAIPYLATMVEQAEFQLSRIAALSLVKMGHQGFNALLDLANESTTGGRLAIEAILRESLVTNDEMTIEQLDRVSQYQWNNFWQLYFAF